MGNRKRACVRKLGGMKLDEPKEGFADPNNAASQTVAESNINTFSKPSFRTLLITSIDGMSVLNLHICRGLVRCCPGTDTEEQQSGNSCTAHPGSMYPSNKSQRVIIKSNQAALKPLAVTCIP